MVWILTSSLVGETAVDYIRNFTSSFCQIFWMKWRDIFANRKSARSFCTDSSNSQLNLSLPLSKLKRIETASDPTVDNTLGFQLWK